MSWVIEHSKHKGNAFVVLLMIANHARSDGSGAWPSVKTLAKEARISPRAVQYTVRRLERSGELLTEVGHGPSGSNLYSLPKYAKYAYASFASPTQHDCAPPTQPPAPAPAITVAPEPSLKQPSINRPIAPSEQSVPALVLDSEPKTSKKAKTKKIKHDLPVDFVPNETNRRIARDLGVNLSNALIEFTEYHGSRGNQFADWHLALNTWLRNEVKFSRGNGRTVGPVVTESPSLLDRLREQTGRAP
jgi:hypothetical protein